MKASTAPLTLNPETTDSPTFDDAWIERAAIGNVYCGNCTQFHGRLIVLSDDDDNNSEYIRLEIGRKSAVGAGEWDQFGGQPARLFLLPGELEGLALLIPELVKLARDRGILLPAAS